MKQSSAPQIGATLVGMNIAHDRHVTPVAARLFTNPRTGAVLDLLTFERGQEVPAPDPQRTLLLLAGRLRAADTVIEPPEDGTVSLARCAYFVEEPARLLSYICPLTRDAGLASSSTEHSQ